MRTGPMLMSLAVLLAGVAVTTGTAGAQDALANCAAIADDHERLTCYDRLAGRVPAAVPASVAATAPVALPPGPIPTVTAADPLADFGLTQTAKRERDPERWARETPQSIAGTVAVVQRNAEDRLVVTLDNDQVWVQSETKPNIILRPGDSVTIRRAAMGSFMLVTSNKLATRVRRVR